ncbi:MAG: LytTR family transcriptional regulator DNA-binding domain-containing protein [Proteobacteria bacterium]|nr:LytTR family transcriptional regulator DNA-binding domain-containing protein [Pseudomonadota bacterium]
MIWLRNLAIAAAAGIFLALTGALETGSVPLPPRLLYWVPIMMAGGVLGHFMAMLINRFSSASRNPWLFAAVLAVVMTIPATLLVWAWTALFFPAVRHLEVLPGFAMNVLLISVAMTAITTIANRPGRVTHAPPAGATLKQVRFLERLPPKLKGAALYAVSAEDHYLRVHTSKGSDLILMRMSDAVAELEGLEGAQTHRSWWVARDAVEGTRRDGDRLTLILKGGAEAPVSRPNIRPLREAGWY